MTVTFKNNSDNSNMIINIANGAYVIEPKKSADVPFCGERITFSAEIISCDLSKDFEDDYKPEKFKDRVLYKLGKKFTEKIPEMSLYTSVTYELISNYQNAIIDLFDSAYCICDGIIAEAIETVPVVYSFPQAETAYGILKIAKVQTTNRKKYLKLISKLLLFIDWMWFLPNLFLFIPKYFFIKILSSDFFVTRLLANLYKLSVHKRAKRIEGNAERLSESKREFLVVVIQLLIFFLIIGSLIFWANTAEPDIISEDFRTVTCFDETFTRIDGKLPEDAKKVFFEDYNAYYPLGDDEYDSDNYYCYIYEDSKGERYMWLKDECSNEENLDKGYEDYENPIVYKSVGEQKED